MVRIIKENDNKKKAAKGAPKYWNSIFATKVIDAYDKGKLTLDNIDEWEKDYNGGKTPNPPLNTKSILKYYLKTGEDPRD